MNNILVINAHQKYPLSEGRLNQTFFENIVEFLAKGYDVKTTVLSEGYLVQEEQEKYKWADAVVIQSPVFWYSFPSVFKAYIEKVYAHNVFYSGSEHYGKGGLLGNKKYMLSLTMGTPLDAFKHSGGFFDGKDIDEVYFHLHKIHQYCAMKPLKTFAACGVVNDPNVLDNLERLSKHIKSIF